MSKQFPRHSSILRHSILWLYVGKRSYYSFFRLDGKMLHLKVFEEEYYIIHDFLLPGFYIATQFFFTLCFTLLLASALMTAAFFGTDRDDDRYIMVLLTNGATQILSC